MLIDEDHSFASFGLSEATLGALTRKGFTDPTSIQSIALPRLLAESGHLVVRARTGTGKTAAFGIPLVERITVRSHAPQALILTPTRELALQVSREIASFVTSSFPRITAVYGGASIRTQILDLKRGTEIVVGTPGRIMDLMDRKILELSGVQWFILDEADEMLDMGFFEDVETIMNALKSGRMSSPAEGHIDKAAPDLPFRVALFSATMPDPILKVVRQHIGNVDILEDRDDGDQGPEILIDQFYMVLKREDRLEALRRIIDGTEDFYGLIFCATKATTDELARRLVESGYPAEAIHGDLSQEARERTLRRFRSKQTTIMVATDVAARGLDIERLTHVINWDLPHDRENYVHRIGRTGRAGRKGRAITLALPSDRGRISQLSRSMERTLGSGILWTKPPSVKSVMKALRARIVSQVLAVLPGDEVVPGTEGAPPGGDIPVAEAVPGTEAGEASPFLAKVCRQLIERLGAERAVEALITVHYGELLDPSRYGLITEFAEESAPRPVQRGDRFVRGNGPRDFAPGDRPHGRRGPPVHGPQGRAPGYGAPGSFREGRFSGGRNAGGEGGLSASARVYVGLGRQHGASAKDVAALLIRAGGVPGRLVDAIEIKDYCAFATLPEDAARRACTFSHNTPGDPPIRLAAPPRQ